MPSRHGLGSLPPSWDAFPALVPPWGPWEPAPSGRPRGISLGRSPRGTVTATRALKQARFRNPSADRGGDRAPPLWVTRDCNLLSPGGCVNQVKSLRSKRRRSIAIQMGCALVPVPWRGLHPTPPPAHSSSRERAPQPPCSQSASAFPGFPGGFPTRSHVKREFHLETT